MAGRTYTRGEDYPDCGRCGGSGFVGGRHGLPVRTCQSCDGCGLDDNEAYRRTPAPIDQNDNTEREV